ncbi:TADA1 family protein [Sporobolomyces koalae]|uniref:TADA1 family protein n=1 Tax=Sporobolomyces koalae TaxID=500713 RepID=UPI003179D799
MGPHEPGGHATGVGASQPAPALSLPDLLPSPTQPPPKRADLISIKQRLALLFSTSNTIATTAAAGGGAGGPNPEGGEVYWNSLTEFLLGKITRIELGEVLEKCFEQFEHQEDKVQAINLHNALLLAILYNTTRPTLPSSSIRHAGFNPRGTKKRNVLSILGNGIGTGYDVAEEDTELQHHRRKKVKQVVMRVGKRERAEIKTLGNQVATVKKEDDTTEALGQLLRTSRGGQGEVTDNGLPKSLQDGIDRQGASLPTNFTQEYNRLVQTPLCCESRSLPDSESLRDRMLLIAYEEGMTNGVDQSGVSVLLADALDLYMKQIISSAVSLVRKPSQRGDPIPSSSSSTTASTFAPAQPHVRAHGAQGSSTRADKNCPLSIADFHALFAIQPALLGPNGSTHTSAVERMYALPPQSDSEDESDSDDEPQQGGAAIEQTVKDDTGDTTMSLDEPPPNSSTTTTITSSGKMPRLSTSSRNRTMSFYGSARAIPSASSSSDPSSSSTAIASSSSSYVANPDRTKFLLDPTSLHGVPEGHPDVPHVVSLPPLLALPPNPLDLPSQSSAPAPVMHSSTSSKSLATSGNANGGNGAGTGPALSPKSLSLRNSLFPELANPTPSSSSSVTTPAGLAAVGSSSGAAGATKLAGENSSLGPNQQDKNGNGTTTDEADSEFDDLTDKIAGELRHGGADKKAKGPANSAGGLKIKLGGSTTGTVTPSGGAGSGQKPVGTQAGTGGGTAAEKEKEMGNKLWQVVDSVRLLDGVLDP